MKNNQIAFAITVLLMVANAACAQQPREAAKTPAASAVSPDSASPCVPLETRTANAPAQKPAFVGQTRGCGVKSDVAFNVTVVARGLSNPWAVEPLPNGDFLITEKTGQLRIVSAKGEVGQPVGGLLPLARAVYHRSADRAVCHPLPRAGKADCSTLL
jgi:glucose/arabinose dehydrogenase